MKVSELIEELLSMPQDAEVLILDSQEYELYPTEVRQRQLHKNKVIIEWEY